LYLIEKKRNLKIINLLNLSLNLSLNLNLLVKSKFNNNLFVPPHFKLQTSTVLCSE